MGIPLIDVFAGPGGLNEGFSSLVGPDGDTAFRTALSVEMEQSACRTLVLRATVRALRRDNAGAIPGVYRDFLREQPPLESFFALPAVERAAAEAHEEVLQLVLGQDTRDESDAAIEGKLGDDIHGEWVLIGGPPCQAYSIAGRSRRTNDPNFANDHKHVLYREYLHILQKFSPPVFVMENVKGLLSSKHEGSSIFSKILEDLQAAGEGYEIRSLVVDKEPEALQPRDFIIRAENYGVPQQRHRVILLGVRTDIAHRARRVLATRPWATVREAIGHLPAIRSQVSPLTQDSELAWALDQQIGSVLAEEPAADAVPPLGARWAKYADALGTRGDLNEWLHDPELDGVVQHEARRHMSKDLQRYAYLAHRAAAGHVPRVMELPEPLMPNHRNARRVDAPFADRFKVQAWDRPSSTVVSHIAKDGHHYIHPDPAQMRSLTVREAARLQTFPDNYFFVGNRTQQYHQVGNAVPPLLARQIGEIVRELLA